MESPIRLSGPYATERTDKPLCIDLFCGLGGWTKGFLSENYRCVGFDIERHRYAFPELPESDGQKGTKPVEKRGWTQGCAISLGMEGPTKQERVRLAEYPGDLVLQDILTVHGSQFRNASCIVASPPCQRYSWMAMPWSESKREIRWQRWLRDSPFSPGFTLNDLFNACFRIREEASLAAGRYIPLVVENVKGAQPWVGRAKARYGSFFLWGDVEDIGGRIVASGPLRFGQPSVKAIGRAPKQPGRNFHFLEKYGIPSPSFHGAEHEASVRDALALKSPGSCGPRMWSDRDFGGNAAFHQEHVKVPSESGRRTDVGNGVRFTSRDCGIGRQKQPIWFNDDKRRADKGGGDWFGAGDDCSLMRSMSSKSSARKAASAAIAEIPFELASHIAKAFYPQ